MISQSVACIYMHVPCWKFLVTEKKISLRNVPGVLKHGGGGGRRKMSKFFFPTNFFFSKMFLGFFFSGGGGGGFWGVWGAPRPHPGVARGRKTIHFFLWPWPVTGLNSGAVQLGGPKLSSGNLGGGRKNK